MSDNTMMVLRETRDVALATLDESTSVADSMLEALSLIHTALDGASIPDQEDGGKSLGVVERVRRLLTKNENDREKLVVTDDLHNKAIATVEEQRLEIEKYRGTAQHNEERIDELVKKCDELEDKVKDQEDDLADQKAIALKNKELEDELERIRLERDEYRDRLAKNEAAKPAQVAPPSFPPPAYGDLFSGFDLLKDNQYYKVEWSAPKQNEFNFNKTNDVFKNYLQNTIEDTVKSYFDKNTAKGGIWQQEVQGGFIPQQKTYSYKS